MTGKLTVSDILSKTSDTSNNDPIDIFFRNFNENIISKLNIGNEIDTLSPYDILNFNSNKDFISYLLNSLLELDELTTKRENKLKEKDSNLLPISLHDMRLVDDLISLIVVHGIDANLNKSSRIPIERKNMSNFKKNSLKFHIPSSHIPNIETLQITLDTILKFFKESIKNKRYLGSALIKGPLFANTIIGYISISLTNPKFVHDLDELESIQETYELFNVYNFILQSVADLNIRNVVLNKLSTLPLRRDNGVISLIDFIVGVRENDQINIDKIARVKQILLSKPESLSSIDYISKLFPQILDGLSYVNRPILITCLNHLITEFYNRNKRIVKDFLFCKINDILFNTRNKNFSIKELNDCINCIISLSKNNSKEFIIEFVKSYDENKFFLYLWIYSMFLKKNQKINPINVQRSKNHETDTPNDSYYEVILSLIQSYMVLANYSEPLEMISLNLVNFEHETWRYCIDLETNMAFIKIKTDQSITGDISKELNLNNKDKTEEYTQEMTELFNDMDLGIELFMNLLKLINNEEATKMIFFNVIRRWVNISIENKDIDNLNATNNALVLVDLKLLEKLNSEYKTEIFKNAQDVLTLVVELLDIITGSNTLDNKKNDIDVEDDSDNEEDSDDEEDSDNNDENKFTSEVGSNSSFAILLELVSTVLEVSNRKVILDNSSLLERIQTKLKKFPDYKRHNLVKQISTKLTERSNEDTVSDEFSEQEEIDTEILKRAMVNLSDVLTPIKVHGLTELRQLVESRSKVIKPERVIQLHLQVLRIQDPYVYLSAIKGLTSLCDIIPAIALPKVLEFYDNKKRTFKLDDILKAGEVLVNYVQLENELFQGPNADLIISSCLNKIRSHETLDNKIRMSAMSLLGVCLQVNAIGIQHHISDLLDCSFGILQLETKEKKDSFIMRRAAIHLIHDLIYNAGIDLFPSNFPVSKVNTLLEYIATQDFDILVVEQAQQLLEILSSYNMPTEGAIKS